LKKYKIIYADPPWSYNDKSMHRGGAERHYNTMSFEEICNLPVQKISADNSVLFIWATFPQIDKALEVINSWGFIYKTCAFNWIKTNKVNKNTLFWGMGWHTRANSEVCLIGVKGKALKRKAKNIHQVVVAPVSKHSKKPDEVRKNIVKMYGYTYPRIELFAREKIRGWDVWGNEVKSSIKL